MSKCKRCNITIKDNTNKCPLCSQVLIDDGNVGERFYPKAWVLTKRFRFFENLLLFLSIVVVALSFPLEYYLADHVAVSMVLLFVLIYANVIVRLAIVGRSGYLFKVISTIIFSLILLESIDVITGNRGWAMTFAYPAAILLMDLGIIILMITNHRNWQSYMMSQLLTIFLSVLGFILWCLGVIRSPYMILIALSVSAFLFLGTFILGDYRARTELKRRFHL